MNPFTRIPPVQGPGYGLGGERSVVFPVAGDLRNPGTDFPGNGDTDLRGDYSVTPGYGRYTNFPDQVEVNDPPNPLAKGWAHTVIEGFTIYYEDDGIFNPDGFGAGAALTNGILVRLNSTNIDGSPASFEFFDGDPIMTNGEWIKWFGGGAVRLANWGAGTIQYMSVHINLKEVFGVTLVLNPGDSIEIEFNDNLNGLTGLNASLHGRIMFDFKNVSNFIHAPFA